MAELFGLADGHIIRVTGFAIGGIVGIQVLRDFPLIEFVLHPAVVGAQEGTGKDTILVPSRECREKGIQGIAHLRAIGAETDFLRQIEIHAAADAFSLRFCRVAHDGKRQLQLIVIVIISAS